jgi:hypothetical protein
MDHLAHTGLDQEVSKGITCNIKKFYLEFNVWMWNTHDMKKTEKVTLLFCMLFMQSAQLQNFDYPWCMKVDTKFNPPFSSMKMHIAKELFTKVRMLASWILKRIICNIN